MAVIQKTLFPKNLDRYSVLVTDTDPNSRYFKITELPDTFTGGKNAFLIAGSEELLGDTKIQIELKDAAGNIIYHEPGEGMVSSSINGETFVTEYFEGVSKVVSVYIYPDTAYGPCTLTILGELSKYEDNNGITTSIPIEWEGKYNVKWQKTINVNPSLSNTTKIRFYQRPTVTIKEILSPIYRIENGLKVNSGVSQSFADIKLSKLETFAGDVKRIKVFRTSVGDISDYDLIQDILVESKELLTSYGLTGSVVGQTGILTSETLKSFWNTGSLNAYLTSSRVESGVRLTGSGNFTYTSSLDIKSTNTYELNLDAFYSSSTPSNLGIYLASGSMSSSIGTLSGISPTKNLLDTIIPFKIPTDFPSASLYFSQSQGEWHLGNISLKLSQDTAFSPDEISFITTMPSVIGNEAFNFKFEFYDVNNNYVPVAVTQSLTFTGGVNVNNTLLLVSSSTSQSLAALAAVSSSISGTMTVYSSSASSSVTTLSGSVSGTIGSVSSSVSGTIGSVSSSVSGTIGRVSGSISGSIYSLSGSVSSSLTLTSGSITLVSSSLLFTSQSLSSSLTTLSASVSSSFSFNSSQSAYQVYSASQYLDKFIFTDANGKLNQPPTASDPGLYLGSEYLGYYNGTGTSGWKTYMDNQGDFYLTSSTIGGGFLAWDSSTATLQIQGAINIQGGNAATTTALSSSLNAVSGAINSATSSLSSSVATTTFTTATGLIAKPPSVLVGGTSGLYLGSTFLGYYNGSDWKTYMANNGNFYLSGAGSDSLTWAGGVLTINGAINITGGNVQSSLSNLNTTTSSLNSSVSNINQATSSINSSITSINSTTSGLDARIFTNSSGLVNKTPSASTSGLYLGSTFLGYYNGSAWKTYMSNTGNFFLSGTGANGLSWDGTTLTINGAITITGGNAATTTYASDVASTAQSNAISTASGDATSKANAAQAAAIASAASDATTKANAAQAAAEAAAIAQASAYVTSLANGGWTAGNGTFITSTSISSPTIAGNAGYISGLFKVGSGGITLDGTNKKIYIGTGTFNNANTAFYVDNNSNFSLGNKLTWDGTTLTIDGAANIGGSTASVVASGAAAGAAALQPGANISSLTNNSGFQTNGDAKTAGSVGGWSISSTTLSANSGRTVLSNDGTIRLKDSNGVSKVLLDYGTTSTADPENASAGTFTIDGLPAGTATFLNGVLTGQSTYGYLQTPGSGTWPYAPTWNRNTVITPTLTGAYEFTFTIPTSSSRKVRWNGGTYHNGYVEMRLYIKDSGGNSMYLGPNGADYVAAPTETVQSSWNYGQGYYGGATQTSFYMSGVNLVAGTPYTVTIQYIVFNLEYDNDVTIDYFYPTTTLSYSAAVASTVINQSGFNVGQDTDRYMFLKPGLLDSMTEASFPGNISFKGRRMLGEIGGTFLLLNSHHQEWHSTMQQVYIGSASFPRSNRSAGGNFMTSHFFGAYNRAFQILRAYAFFEPDSSTNNSGVYTDFCWPYNMNIEKITYVTTNTFQVYFVEPVMDAGGYSYPNSPFYSVDVIASGGYNLSLIRLFDTTTTSFKMELNGEWSDGSRVAVIVYK